MDQCTHPTKGVDPIQETEIEEEVQLQDQVRHSKVDPDPIRRKNPDIVAATVPAATKKPELHEFQWI